MSKKDRPTEEASNGTKFLSPADLEVLKESLHRVHEAKSALWDMREQYEAALAKAKQEVDRHVETGRAVLARYGVLGPAEIVESTGEIKV